MESATEQGVNVDEERKLASGINAMVEREGYVPAIDAIKAGKKTLEDGMKIHRRRTCTKKLRTASRELAGFQKEARMAFPDMQEARDLAFDALEKEDYDDVEANLDRFNEAWDQHKIEYRVGRYGSELEKREAEIDAITQLNIDLPDTAEILSQARQSLSNDDFDSVDASISDLDSIISDVKGDRAGKLAAELMKTNGERLGRMKEKGIDVEEFEAIMEEAREAAAGNNNLEAYRLAMEVEVGLSEARAGARKKAGSKLLDEVKILLSKATELWLDTGDLPGKAEEAETRFSDGDYGGAKELLVEVRTGLAGMLNEKQLEIYQFRYDELVGISDKAREMKVDISDEQDRISEIEKLGDAENYEDAVDMMKECKRSIDKKIEDHEASASEKLLEKAEDDLLALEKATGSKYEDLGGLLDMVSSALDNGDYEKLGGILNDFYQIKSDHETRYNREKYTAELKRLKNAVESLKTLGIGLDDAVSLIAKADDALAEGQLDDLKGILSELEPLYENIRTERAKKKTGLIVKEINILFERLIERGTDLESDRELFKEIVHSIKGNDFPKACKLAIKCRKLLLKKDKRYTAREVGTRVKEAKDLYEKIADQTHLAPEKVNEFKGVLEMVEARLEANELDGAQEALGELTDAEEEMADEMGKADEVATLLENVDELMERAEKLTIDFEDENDLMGDADELLDKYELDGVIPLLKEVNESLRSKIDLRQRDESKAALEEARERFEECREIVVDSNQITSRLDQALRHLEAEEYELSLELSRRILEEIEGTKVEQSANEIRELLRSSDKLIKETRELGGDTARVEAIYYKATYYLEKNDHEKGKKYASMALDRAMKSRMALDKSAAAVLVDKIRVIRDEAESNDLATEALENLITEAEGHVEDARQDEIMVLLSRAGEELRKAEVSALLSRTRDLMEKAAGLWLEVDEHRLTVQEAEEAYEHGELDRASTLAGATENALAKLIDSAYGEKMQLQGQTMMSLLKKAQNLGVDTSDESKMLSGIRKMKEEGRYEEATNVLLEAISALERKNDQHAMMSARKGLEELEKTAGVNEDLNALLEKADIALGKGNRKGFAAILDDFHTTKEKFVQSLSQKKYSGELSELQSQLDEFAGVGLDVSVPRKILEEVDEALAAKRLDESKEGLARLNDIMKDIRLVKIRDLAWENFGQAEDSIKETRALNIDVMDAKQLLQKAREAVRQGDYINGTRISSEVLDLCERLRHEREDEEHSTKIARAREFLESLREYDFLPDKFTKDMEEAVEAAEEALEAGETDELLERIADIKELETTTRATIENMKDARSKLDELRIRLEKAAGLWLDVDEHKPTVEEAEEAFENGDFDRALTLAEETGDALTKLIDSAFEEKMELQGKNMISLLKKAQSLGVDTKNESRMLSGIRKMKEKGDYEEATNVLLEAISSLESKNDQHALASAREGLEELEKTAGVETEDLNTLMEKADKALAKGNRKGFTAILDDFHTSKEKFVRKLSQKKYSGEISELAGQLDDFEGVGLDVSVPRGILEEVEEALAAKRLDDSKEGLARLNDIMKDIRLVKIQDLAWENFGQAEEIVEEILALNIDVTDARQLLRQARRSVRQGDFIKGTRISSEVQEMCVRLRQEREGEEHSTRINKAREFLESLREYDFLPDKYTKDMEGAVEAAEKAQETGKTDDVLERINDIKELEKATMADIEKIKDARSRLDELKTLLQEATGLGIDVADDEDDMEEAGELLRDGKFQELFALLEDMHGFLTEKIDELKEKKAVASFEKAGESLEKYRETLKDTEVVETSMSEIRELLDGGKFEEARSLSEDLMNSMELSREKSHREELEAALDRLWEYIAKNEKLDIDTSRAEGLFYKSKYFTEKGDYENANKSMNAAKEKAEEGRNAYEKEKATASMGEVEDLMKAESHLGIDLSELEEEMDEAKDLFDKDKYHKSWKLAEKIMADLSDRIKGRYLELISQGKDALNSLIDKGKGLGADMEEGIARLPTVDELRDETKYKKALEHIVAIRALVEKQIAARLAEINSDKLEDALAELEELEEESGNEYDDLQEIMADARKALDSLEYDELDGILAEFADARAEHHAVYLVGKYSSRAGELEAVAADLTKLGLDVSATTDMLSDIGESIKDRDFNAVTEGLAELDREIADARESKAKVRAKEIIGVTNKLFTELNKLDVDVQKENKMFKEVLVAVRGRDYVTGIRLTLEAREGLLNAKRDYYREMSSEIISSVESSMDEGRQLNIDVTRVEELHEDAMKCYEEEDYQQAYDLIDEARSSYGKDRKEYFRIKAEGSMELMKSLMNQAGALWIDVDEFQDIYGEMKLDYDEEKYEEMLEKAERANADIKASIEEKLLENIGKKTEELAKIMGEAHGLDVDTGTERDGLLDVDELKEEKKYSDIIELLDESRDSIEKKIAARLKEINSDKVGKVREELEAFEDETDSDYDDLWGFIESAEKALDEGDYGTQDSIIGEFRKAKADHYRQYLAEKYEKTADELSYESDELSELGLDLSEARELLETVKENVRDFDFTGTEATLEKIEALFENARTEQAKELAKKHFLATKELLAEMKEKEVEMTEENEGFRLAIEAIKSKDFVVACRLMRKAEEMVTAAREQYYKKKAGEELEWAKDMVIDGVELELDMGFIHECLDRAEKQYEEAEYENSIDSVGEARSDFRQRRTAYWKKRAEDALEKVGDITKEGHDLELDMEEIETLIGDAEAYFDEADHKKVLELSQEVEDKFSALRTDHFMEEGRSSLALLEEALGEGSELGLDTDGIRETQGLAASLFDEEHYERALDTAEQARNSYRQLRQTHFKENTDTALNELKKMIAEATEFNVDISAVKEDLGSIRSLYDQEKFQETYELSENSGRELRADIDREQLARLGDEISGLEEEIERARGVDADVQREEDELASVEEMKAEGSYRECIMRVKELRADTNHKYESRLAEINADKLKETMDSLENFMDETAGEYPGLDELAASAGKALDEKNYTAFEEVLERFHAAKEEENRKYLFAKYDGETTELEEEMTPLKELGLDISSTEELADSAREYLESYEFEKVVEVLDGIREGLTEARNVGAKDLAKKHFLSTKTALGELKELDVVVEEFDILFKKAIAAIKGRDFVTACQLFLEAGGSMGEARKEYFRESTEETVDNIKKLMDEAAELELNIETFTELDERVKESYDAGEFEEAYGQAAECETELREAVNTELLDIIETYEDKFEELAAEALKIDADVQAEKESLAETERLREKERYRDIIAMLENAISSASRKIDERTFVINEEKFNGAQEVLEALESETGGEYLDLHSRLKEAGELLSQKNYSELDTSLLEFEEAREMHYITYLTETYNERMEAVEEELDVILDAGIELPEAEELSGTAREAIDDKRFEDAKAALDKLDEIIDDAKKVKAKQIAKSKFTETNKLLTKLKRLGTDLTSEEKVFREILGAIKTRDFLKSIRLTRSVQEKLDSVKKEHSRKGAVAAIQSLEGMLGDAGKRLADVVSVEKIREKAMEHFEKEDFDNALLMVGQAKKEYEEKRKEFQREMLTGSLDRLQGLISEAVELDIDVGSYERKMGELRSGFENEEYDEAEELAGNTITGLESTIENRYLALIEERTGELARAMEEAGGMGVDMKAERERLSATAELKGEKRYREIIDLLEECRDTVTKGISDQRSELFTEKLQENLDALELFREETEDTYEDLDSLLDSARDALEREDYEAMDEFLVEFNTAKEEHKNQYLANGYATRLKELESENVALGDIGLSMREVPELLAVAKENAAAYDFDGIEAKISDIEDMIEHARSVEAKKLAKKHFIRSKELIEEMKKTGVGLEEENQLFRDAVTAIKAGEFVKGVGLTQRSEKLLTEKREHYYVEATEAELENVDRLKTEAIELDLSVDEMLESSKEARAFLDDKLYPQALTLSRATTAALREMVNLSLGKMLDNEKADLESRMEAARELGIDLESVNDAVNMAVEYGKAGDHRKAIEVLRNEQPVLDEAMAARTREMKEQAVAAARENLVAFSGITGKDYPDLEGYIENAAISLDDNNYEGTDEQLDTFREALEGYEREHKAENYRRELRAREPGIAAITEIGIELTEIFELVSRAAELISRHDFKALEETLALIDGGVEEARNVTAKDAARERIAAAKGLFDQLTEAGLELDEEKKLFGEVLSQVREGNFVKACRMADGATEMLRNKEKEYLRSRAEAALSDAVAALVDIDELDVETGPVEKSLGEARVFYDWKDYVKSEETARATVVMAEAIKKEYRKRMVFAMIEGVEEALKEGAELGMDTATMAVEIADAYGLVDDGNLEEAERMANETNNLFQASRKAHLEGMTTAAFETARDMMGKAVALGLDTVSIETMLEYANIHTEDEEYENAQELIKQARETLTDMIGGKELERVDSEIAETEKLMEEAGNYSVDIGEYLEKLDRMKELRNDGAYGKIISVGKKLRESLVENIDLRRKEINSQRLSDGMAKWEDHVRETGAEHPGMEAALNAAREAIKLGDHQALDIKLHEFDELMKEGRRTLLLSTYSERLDRMVTEVAALGEAGIDVTSIEEIVGNVRTDLNAQRFETVETALGRLETTVHEASTVTAKKLAKEHAGEAMKLFTYLGEHGVDLQEEKAHFREVRTHVMEERFTDACRLLIRIRSKLKTAEENYYTEQATQALEDIREGISEARKLEIDIADLEHSESVLRAAYDDGLFDAAVEQASVIRDELQMRIGVKRWESVVAELTSLEPVMEVARTMSMDIGEESSMILGIESLKDGWKYREALEIIAEVERSLMKKIDEMNRMENQVKIDAAVGALEKLEGMTGKTHEELRERLDAASKALGEADHSGVAATIEEFYSARDSIERSYLGDSYGRRLGVLEEDMARLAAVGIELSEAAEFIAGIKGDITTGNLDRTSEGLEVLEKLLEEARGEGAKEKASALFTETKKLMTEIKESRMEAEAAEDTFRQAVISIKNGDFLAGCELLLTSRKTVSESLDAYYEERVHVALSETDELIAKAEEMGNIELDEVHGLIGNGRNLLVAENFKESLEILGQAMTLLRERMNLRWEEILAEKTEEVNRIVQGSMEFGVEVRDELARLGPVAVLREEGRYVEAMELVESVGSSLSTKLKEGKGKQDAQKLSEAELAFRQFQEISGDGAEILGANLVKAREALMAGDHTALDEHLNAFSVMREEQNNLLLARKYQDELNGYQELFKGYLELGLDISPGMGMISEARTSISENSFNVMPDIISRLGDFKESTTNVQAREITKIHLGEAKELLVGVRALGVEMESDGEIFRDVLSAVKARDFMSACHAAVQVKKRLSDTRMKHLENNTDLLLEDTAKRLAEGKELGLDVTGVEDIIGNAHLFVSDGKLEEAAKLAKEAKANLDNVFDGHLREKYLAAAQDAEKILADIKSLEVPCSVMEEKFVSARTLFDDGRISEGSAMMEELAGELSRTREDSLKERAVRALEAAKTVQGRCGEMGLEPGPAVKILMNAQASFDQNLFTETYNLAEEARKLLSEAEGKYLKRDTSALISAVWNLMGESSEMGLDLGPIEEKIAMAQQSLKEGDLEKSYALAIESRKEITEKMDAKLVATYDDEYNDISGILAQAHQKGADTDVEVDMLAGIEELKEAGNYSEAIPALAKLKTSLFEKINTIQEEATASKIREKISTLEALERMLGRSLGDLKEMLLSSQEAIGMKDLDAADAFLRQFDEVIEQYLGEVKVKDYEGRISGLNNSVNMLEELGLDVSRGRELLSGIMKSMQRNDIGSMKENIPQVEDFIEQARTVDAKELAKQHIVGIKRLFGEMKANGIDTSEEDVMLKDVVGAIKEQDFITAIELTKKANASLSAKRDRHFTEDVSELMSETRVLLGEGGELGLDTAGMENKLAEGQEHFENGDFQKAAELARQAKDMFERAKQQHYREFTTAALAAIQELMIDEMEMDVDMIAVEDMVANARRNLEKGDFERSAKYAEEAKAALLTAQNEFSRNNASAEIESVRAMVEEAEKLGLEMSDSLKALAEMSEHFEQGRFKEALEIAKESQGTVRQLLNSRLKGDIRSEIAKLSPLMDTARELNLDLREETSVLASIENLKELGKYYEAMSTVKGIETSVANKIHLHRRRAGGDNLVQAVDKMAALEREVRDIPGLDLDISDLNSLLSSATAASDTSDFASAKGFLDKFFDLELRYSNMLITKIYPGEAKRLAEEIGALKEIGIVVAVAEELVNSLRENIDEGNLETARELRNQILDIIDDSRNLPAKEIAKQHITTLKTSFRSLKEREVDLGEEEELFKQVLVALKDEDYLKGTQLMLRVEKRLAHKRQDFFETKIGEVLSDVDRIVRQASQKKLEISDIRKIAFEARALFKRKKYENSMELAEKARTLVTDVWQRSLEEDAGLALEEVLALQKEKTGGSLELAGVAELVEKAVRENENGEFIACLEHVEEARSMILALEQEDLLGHATERLTLAMDFIAEAEEAGMSTGELERDMETAQAHFDEGRYNEAVNTVNRMEAKVRTVRLEKAETRVGSQLKEFDSFIGELDTKPYLSEEYKADIRGRVAKVHELFGNGEFLIAEDKLETLRETLEGLMAKIKLEDEYMSLVKAAGDLIARGKVNGIEVDEEEKGYEQAVTRKEEGDLGGAIETLLEVHGSLIGTVGELLIEEARGLLVEVERAVEDNRDIIEDMSGFEERKAKAKECLEAGDPEGCMVLLREIQTLLDQRREKITMGEVEANIARAKEELEISKGMGFDIFEIEAYIFKAFSAFQNGDYQEADDLARRAIGSAREKREGVDEGKIRIMLRNTEMLMVDCGELGIDIGAIEDGISLAEQYLEDRRLNDAKELMEKLNAQVKEQIEVKLIEVIPQHIREISGLIEEAEEEGADMEEESMSLISIETLNQEGRYLGAMKLIGPLRDAIGEKIGAKKTEKATSKLELAFADFNEYKMTSIGDNDELEAVLDNALNASTDGDAEEMERKIEEYYELKKEQEKQWAIEKHTIGIDDLEKKLSSLTEIDIDIITGTELVGVAKEQLEEESMDELEATMEELESFVNSLFEDKIRPETEENIKDIDRMMDRLREKGVEVNEEEELFSEILTAMDDEDFVAAYAKSGRLRLSVRTVWGHRRKDILRDLLDELEEFLRQLDSDDFFSEQYKDMMKNAVDEIRDHFHAEEFDLMEEKHELFKGTIDDLKAKMKIREEVENLREEAVRYKEAAEGIAADVTGELKELEKVEGLVDSEEFNDAKSLLEGIIKKMKKKINVRRMSIAKMVIEDALYTYNDRKDKIDPGIVKTAQGLLSDATKQFKKGKFEKAIKMATELKEGLEDAEEIAPEAPPEEPAPEEPPVKEAAPKPKKVKLTCPRCSKSYVAKIAKTPAVAVCPYCGSKAVIKNI